MLKGHVFSKQIFNNSIFALFINTFLSGKDGVSNNYKNGMEVTYSGRNISIDTGAVCIQGRFLEEDSLTQLSTGTDNAFCKLVIEIDLNKQNTETSFVQGAYKIIKSTSNYPNLTQTNIVKNNAGIYQYELARFKTTSAGISEFEDRRTFLDFETIYTYIENDYKNVLEELQEQLNGIKNQSNIMFKDMVKTVEGTVDLTNGAGSTTVPYPNGFAQNNCVLISAAIKIVGDNYDYFKINNNSDSLLGARLTQNNIRFECSNESGIGSSGIKDFKIVLMKVS